MKKELLRMEYVSTDSEEGSGLRDFSFYLCEGEFVNLIGLSGAGKSALYEYLSGQSPLKAGYVLYDEKESKAKEAFSFASDVFCMGEGSTLIPGLSIAENIFVISGKRKVRGFIWLPNVYYRARFLLSQYAPWLAPKTPIYNFYIFTSVYITQE